MPFIPVPDCVEARLHFIMNGSEEAVNVLHFRKSVDLGDPQAMSSSYADDLGSQIFGSWGTNLKPDLTTLISLDHITIKDIDQADRNSFVYLTDPDTNSGDIGPSTSRPLPNQVALVATLYTDSGSRGGRGRVYTAGHVSSHITTGGLADNGLRDAVKAFLTDLQSFDIANDATPPDTMHMHLAVASRSAHVGSVLTGDPVDPVARAVTDVSVNARFDTQRRRAASQRF